MAIVTSLWKWLILNWERVLFILVGIAFLAACFDLVLVEKIAEAAMLFGLSLFSFIYANLAKFKRFKGFGIEAELWEDKQKEAAALIQQLRGLVTTYSNELLMSKVKGGRWGPVDDWADRWKLFEKFTAQHRQLGLEIDFSQVKREMDDYFLFDMTLPEIDKLDKLMRRQLSAVSKKIDEEFGSPINDSEGYGKRLAQRNSVWQRLEDPFRFARTHNLAKMLLDQVSEAKKMLKRDFSLEIIDESEVVSRLQEIAALYENRPVRVTDQLVKWADRNE